jgi:hypothetical protein
MYDSGEISLTCLTKYAIFLLIGKIMLGYWTVSIFKLLIYLILKWNIFEKKKTLKKVQKWK